MRCPQNWPEYKRRLVWGPWVLGWECREGDTVPLLQSTQVHIPLLGQCCLFNRSASCLWLLSFLLNITGQIPSSHRPHSSPPSCLSFPADSSCEELLLTFLKCINCERIFGEPEMPSARGRRKSIAGRRLEGPGRGLELWPCRI